MSGQYKLTITDDPTADGNTFEADSFGAVLGEVFALVAGVPESFPPCDLAMLLEVLGELANAYGNDDTLGVYEFNVGNPMAGAGIYIRAEFPEDPYA